MPLSVGPATITTTVQQHSGEHLVELHIPAPRTELSADELRERLIALAPSTLELRRRLDEARDD